MDPTGKERQGVLTVQCVSIVSEQKQFEVQSTIHQLRLYSGHVLVYIHILVLSTKDESSR